MQVITDYANCPDSAKNTVLALGNFDGVHRGHQHVIGKAKKIAKEAKGLTAVMTFSPHPLHVLKENVHPFELTTLEQKLSLFERAGVDVVFVFSFNQEFSLLTGEEFVEKILAEALAVRHIVIGHDFIFGHKRSGNADLLKEKAIQYNYKFTQMDALGDEDRVFSSSHIRHAIKNGEVKLANEMLGRAFSIKGKVIEGEKRGRKLGFPTANLSLNGYIRPAFGVYAVSVQDEWGKKHLGVANIGVRPSIGEYQENIEVHLFDFDEKIYDKYLEIELRAFIREEQKFDSLDKLKQQINQDCITAKELLHE